MRPIARAAFARASGSTSSSTRVSAGTAAAAPEPRRPSTLAASPRTSPFSSSRARSRVARMSGARERIRAKAQRAPNLGSASVSVRRARRSAGTAGSMSTGSNLPIVQPARARTSLDGWERSSSAFARISSTGTSRRIKAFTAAARAAESSSSRDSRARRRTTALSARIGARRPSASADLALTTGSELSSGATSAVVIGRSRIVDCWATNAS